jgi:Na+/serine symporter
VASLSISSLRAANVETLGIVVTSRSATLGNGIVSDGATLSDGDFSLLPLAISAAGASVGLAAPMFTLGEIILVDRNSFEIRPP